MIVSNSVVSSEPKPGLRNGSVGGLAVGRAPPSVPPRNGSKLETPGELGVNGGQRQKYFDTNIEPQPSEKNNFIKTDIVKPVSVGERTVIKNDPVVNKSDPQKAVIGRPEAQETNTVDSTDNKNNYRDSWKSRNDTQNTFTFNFVNSKKDVSHIENDGLDLTNRNKKVEIFRKPLDRTFEAPKRRLGCCLGKENVIAMACNSLVGAALLALAFSTLVIAGIKNATSLLNRILSPAMDVRI